MPYCSKCETDYEDGASCCEECGEPLPKDISILQIVLVAPIVFIATLILQLLCLFVTDITYWSSGRLEFAILPTAYICLAAFCFGIVFPSWALWVCWLESAFLLLLTLSNLSSFNLTVFLVLVVMPLALIIATTQFGSLFRQKGKRVSALSKLAIAWALPSLVIYLLYPMIELPFIF